MGSLCLGGELEPALWPFAKEASILTIENNFADRCNSIVAALMRRIVSLEFSKEMVRGSHLLFGRLRREEVIRFNSNRLITTDGKFALAAAADPAFLREVHDHPSSRGNHGDPQNQV